ncbi:carbonic anhydrase [Clostridiaceae bacterium UIB06]|uniref:Carbonic anhydrase n=1 Tax=Clostridium thailandense TaxID=2794346 RepID=A0A949U3B5_9CLOT|nr:carbonic anhydrase [Clostridium thailandense]MBV7276685.1 carbonic anhydrase [Clostridium thailandense]MCH5137715.1 carbonic anhydrase [Clostridiaceae bacterium UIB06]
MCNLIKVSDESEVFYKYKNTPVEKLLKYHNFGYTVEKPSKAEILVGMCMDNRNQLRIPNNFAYILRTGGGNMRSIEFKISYAIAMGGVKCVALIGHNNCGMTNLVSKKKKFIEGMVNNAGWSEKQAEEHFMSFAPIFEIENEIEFLVSETKRLREKYPKILIAPLFYSVEDHFLYLLENDKDMF